MKHKRTHNPLQLESKLDSQLNSKFYIAKLKKNLRAPA